MFCRVTVLPLAGLAVGLTVDKGAVVGEVVLSHAAKMTAVPTRIKVLRNMESFHLSLIGD